MTENRQARFNLWFDPWIDLETSSGTIARLGVEETLIQANQKLVAVFDNSPLVLVGIHRLLTAILQYIYNPQRQKDLSNLWNEGRFDPDKVIGFGQQFANRFDLFSEANPFMQSADLTLSPSKNESVKTIAYLAAQMPSGTGIVHYRHSSDNSQVFCPVCAAKGLVTIPAFATSGGAGIKPSINGVPPIYVIPGGDNLFNKLCTSLILPAYKPKIASQNNDQVWWKRDGVVQRSKELLQVGYLHSLTFPARRVRLHPEKLNAVCTLCGEQTEWGMRTMVFEMGETRPKGSEAWIDPFVGYSIKPDKPPTPIRPQRGKALWREYGSLFLSHGVARNQSLSIRPAILDQAAALAIEGINSTDTQRTFRCIGMVTDMKAKVFEWVDVGYDVPISLLEDEFAGIEVDRAIQFAQDCAKILTDVFKRHFGGTGKGATRHSRLRFDLVNQYWANLAFPFRGFILALAGEPKGHGAIMGWIDTVILVARNMMSETIQLIGNDAASLRDRVKAENDCNVCLFDRKRKENL